MAQESPAGKGPFDLERLRELVEMMKEHDLGEVTLRRGNEHIRVRRGAMVAPMIQAAPIAAGAPQAGPAASQASSASAASSGREEGLLEIKSPTVGTFYASPTPDDPPFVTVGARVTTETVVCLVEAMKVFNQIPAEVSGTIVEVVAKNGDAVEFGQTLFRVRPG